jgi:peptide/nickel transport system permease protein
LLSLVWTPQSPYEIDMALRMQPPDASHWLGTDPYGRDIASLLLVGARASIAVGVIAVGIGLLVGTALGLLASACRGWTEEVIMRVADFGFAFPAILSAIMLTAVFGPGMVIAIVAIGIYNIPTFARITRASANQIWGREYVLAASAAGKGAWRITIEHVLPNIASVLIVQATIRFAIAILAEAALSFIGVGVRSPTPSWGLMINEGSKYFVTSPYLLIFPGAAIFITVLAFLFVGDGLRDALDTKELV